MVVGFSVWLGGCSVVGGAVADSATTFHGINSGIAEEANPLLPKSASGAALASGALKLGMAYGAKRYFPEHCVSLATGITATGWGAAVNNLLVMSNVSGYGPLVAGVVTYFVVKSFPETKKNAVEFCNG